MDAHPTVTLGLIAVLGILSQWLAWRFRMPAIILLLGAGIAAGPGLGIIRPGETFGDLLGPVVKLCVGLILFEGGLHLKLPELKHAGKGVKRLVFPGVAISWALGSVAAILVGGIAVPVGLVIGAILVVTGPTVIMPLLRHARLRRGPASLLKWEGIVNDPIGALLAVLVVQYLTHSGTESPAEDVAVSVALTVAMSLLLGVGGGRLLAAAFRRAWVPEYLKSPVLFGSAIAVYVAADLVQHEAGLAAATVLGLVLGNRRLPSIDQLRRFKEYIAIVLVSTVFILLSANLDPAGLANLPLRAWLFVAAILVVVRPASVFLATAGAGVPWRERLLVAWIAPRGVVAAAVAAAFSIDLAGFEDADKMVPIVFSIIIATVVLHGLTIRGLARRLDLAAPSANGVLIVGASPFGIQLAESLRDLGLPVVVADPSWQRLRPARMAGIPTHYGEILSEVSEENLELSEIGYLLALSGNDAYNALVCQAFANELGRDRVFQIAMQAGDEDDPRGLQIGLRGNTLFVEEATYFLLVRRHYEGWRFRKTTLTETYDEREHRESTENGAIPILRLRESGMPSFARAGGGQAAAPGDTVLVYAPPEPTG